jgi:hypothetical protein
MKKLALLLGLVFIAQTAHAQQTLCRQNLVGPFTPFQAAEICEVFPGLLSYKGAQKPTFPASVVLTPAVTAITTPVTAQILSGADSRIVSGSPTLAAVMLPQVTANVGKSYNLWSYSANPVIIQPQGGDTVNATAALTPYSCAAGKKCTCQGLSTGLWGCDQ